MDHAEGSGQADERLGGYRSAPAYRRPSREPKRSRRIKATSQPQGRRKSFFDHKPNAQNPETDQGRSAKFAHIMIPVMYSMRPITSGDTLALLMQQYHKTCDAAEAEPDMAKVAVLWDDFVERIDLVTPATENAKVFLAKLKAKTQRLADLHR